MYITFKDINESDITLAISAIWGITLPLNEGLGEVLLDGANKSVKVARETAVALKAFLKPANA